MLNEEELWDALDEFHAYDNGFISDIRTKMSREQVRTILLVMSEKERMAFISPRVRDKYLSNAALAQGYSIGDVAEFSEWFNGQLLT